MKSDIIKYLRSIPLTEKLIKEREIKKQYENEIKLLRCKSLNQSKQNSIIHFSFSKAATQYVRDIFQLISYENGLIPVNLNGLAYVSDMPYLDQLNDKEMKEYKHMFKPTGFTYSVFGGMVENIDEFDKYKVFYFVRDPRDLLVSDYFSTLYSHPIPPKTSNKRKDFINKKSHAEQGDIDEFVMRQSDRLKGKFDRYKVELLDKYPNVVFTRYEDMIDDYNSWLDKLKEICEVKLSADLEKKLKENFDSSYLETEDKSKHKRKGKSGDYLIKLKPETIDFLSNKFREHLIEYNYPLN